MHQFCCVAQGIIIYTDGAALGNPGPGGYGAVLMYGPNRKELSEGFRLTTNNRMELLAVIRALQQLKQTEIPVIIHSDSQYVCKAVNEGWLFNWKKKGWVKVKNPDLWKVFLELYTMFKPKMQWVKGHAGIPENERCDLLATSAASTQAVGVDAWYEANRNSADGLF